MKRFILPLAFVAIMVTVIGAIGYIVVKYALELSTHPRAFSYEELEKLQDRERIDDTDMPRLLAGLDRNDEDIRLMSALTLAKLGPAALEPLRERLKHQNAKVRFAALQAFAAMKPEDVLLAARDVTACLDDLDADVRRKAVYVVGIIGDKNEAAFEALVKSLNDKDLSVVEAAADTLQKVEAPPKEALPALTKLAGDANYQIRTTALKLLGKLGAPAIPVFKEHLKKLNADERGPILESLATMGKAAKPVLPELQAILIEDRWWDGSNHIFAIIKNCGPDGAQTLADVLKVLHDPKTPHFEAAEDRARTLLKALGDMGPQAAAATPVLIVMLKDREPLRPNVLDTLGDIGPAAKDAIPAVQALTADPRVGSMARATLKRMGVLSNK